MNEVAAPPDVVSGVGLPADVHREAVGFAARLRAAGLRIPTGATIAYLEALSSMSHGTTLQTYWAGRATLVTRPEDVAVYDSVFWSAATTVAPAPVPVEQATLSVDDAEGDGHGEGTDGEQADVPVLRFSAVETLRHRDFEQYTDAERALADQLMSRLRLATPTRRSSRLVPSGRRGERPDVRGTVRASMRAAGEPAARRWRTTGHRPRRLVLLLDVSGSMESYARALLRFVHAAVAGRQRVEAFTFGTRLTRITRELSARDPDVATTNAGDRVADWSGGTRLGECLRQFNDRWAVRGMARGAVVVILSDGWDRGDTAELGAQMARLHRVTHRLVWVNPLKVTPGYAPLARGMAAALPHVDDFVEGHSLGALERLIAVIGDEDAPDRAGQRSARAIGTAAHSTASHSTGAHGRAGGR